MGQTENRGDFGDLYAINEQRRRTMAAETSSPKTARQFICPHCNASYESYPPLFLVEICDADARVDFVDRDICLDIKEVVRVPLFGNFLTTDTNEKPFRCPHCESAFGR